MTPRRTCEWCEHWSTLEETRHDILDTLRYCFHGKVEIIILAAHAVMTRRHQSCNKFAPCKEAIPYFRTMDYMDAVLSREDE